MAYDYDKLYRETPNALGSPTQIFVDFFRTYPNAQAQVLDVGCGQGRDALFIARLGHHVVGVDMAANGIRDMAKVASAEGLNIDGIVADITRYHPAQNFDVILIDRTLHMLETEPRQVVLGRLLNHITPGGHVLIADEKANMAGFRKTIKNHPSSWDETYAKGGYLFLQSLK